MPSAHLVQQVLRVIVTFALCFYMIRQVRKPDRWAGRFFVWIMNLSHSGVTDWGLGHVRIERNFTILDVGCGGGQTIQKLAALAADGKVYGVDYASGSVAASRSKNAELIRAGRVEIQLASVSQLPYADNTFDLVTAVETQYYWPDLVHDMQEVLRVLKPGGTLTVVLEVYKRAGHNVMERQVMKLLKSADMGVDEQRELFQAAGYADVQIFEERQRGWLCATGKKPS